MKKITKATVKSFMRKNEGRLFIKCRSSFDGMTDGIEFNPTATYRPLVREPVNPARPFVGDITGPTLGYGVGSGVWFVGDSRDYFTPINEDGFEGYQVNNSCGSFIVATKIKYYSNRPGDAPAIMAEETGIDYSRCLVMCNCD
jgi:hypothetical protein